MGHRHKNALTSGDVWMLVSVVYFAILYAVQGSWWMIFVGALLALLAFTSRAKKKA